MRPLLGRLSQLVSRYDLSSATAPLGLLPLAAKHSFVSLVQLKLVAQLHSREPVDQLVDLGRLIEHCVRS